MTATAPTRKRKVSRPPTDGWWGNGPPPWARWPGVTIQLDARWDGARWLSIDGKYWFDQEAADLACDFFPEFLQHHKGEFAGLPFTLLPYQDQLIVRPLFGWKRVSDNLRRFRKVFFAVPKGNGKALALDTRVPTPSGWSTMGDLAVGDEVFDERGEVCHVIAATQVMTDRPCYRLRFSDGPSIVADADHQWLTTTQRNGQSRGRKDNGPRLGWPVLSTTAEIARTLCPPPSPSIHPQAKWNHRIEMAGPLRTEGVVLPIPPYTLGAWLGDGDSDCARLTMAFVDAEIADAICGEGVTITQQRRHSETTGRYSLGIGSRGGSAASRSGSLNARLRALGLLRNKHIPAVYLRASIEQRLALLQGLMDTDGYIDADKGSAEFGTTSAPIAAGVVELLRTLGYKARLREGHATLRGRIIGPLYRLQFMPTADRPVFRLARKLNRMRPAPASRRLSQSRRIVGCDPVPSVPVRCIAVDSPSRLFLAGDAMVPTHNSPLGAGLGLYLTFCDGESGAEVYCAAADRDQAAIVFDTARIMVEGNPELAEQANVLRRAIELPATHSYYRVLSADVRTKHGPNIHGLIFDEFHAQATRELYEVLHRGTVKRRQPVTLMITTAGDDDESICAEEWDYARHVMAGSYEDATYLPIIFEAGRDENWEDEELWKRVNPGFDITVKADAIRAEHAAARQEPRKLNDFLRYHLNRWVNQATAWIPIDWWDACKGPLPENLDTLKVYAGLDLAQKNDLAAFVLTFVTPLEGPAIEVEVVATDERAEPVKRNISLNYSISLVPYFWIPEETMLEHEKKDRVPYRLWADQGLVRATEGNVIDYDTIYRDITGEITQSYPLLRESQIAFDPAFATDIAQKLQGSGYQMVEVLQNYQRLSEPSHVFEAFVRGKRVRHDGHPVLRWNMENVAIRQDDAGRIRPVKPRRQAKRIDGVVASIMGLSRAIVAPVQQESSWRFLTVE